MSSETLALQYFLDAQRRAVIEVLAGVPDEELRRPALSSGWTMLGLMQHLAYCEQYWFRDIAAGEHIEDPGTAEDPDADWRVGPDRTADSVFAFYRDEIARANSILLATPLDAPPTRREERWGPEWCPDFRSIVLHMIEETARHAGHLDIVRELFDGTTGLG